MNSNIEAVGSLKTATRAEYYQGISDYWPTWRVSEKITSCSSRRFMIQVC